MKLKIANGTLRTLTVAKVYQEGHDRINSIDFTSNGEQMIASSEDDQIILFDALQGTPIRSLNSKKYGVDLIQFTHTNDTALHCSTKVDDAIRFLNLEDNKYLRYFPGHTQRVVSLCSSPVSETFLSGSLDKSIRLWDARSPNCQGLLHVPGRSVAAYDPAGLVFAVGINNECIKLYDLRLFDKGPFDTFPVAKETGYEWTNLKFSADGKVIMLSTNSTLIRLFDAFRGQAMHTLTGFPNDKHLPIEPCFSPDGKFVFSGSSNGRIHVWDAENGCKVCVLNGDHTGPVQCVKFNPKYALLVSACKAIAFWLPTGKME